MRLFLKITSLTALALLAGCSREPTEQELRQAYEESLVEANQIAVRIGGDSMKIDLEDFKKLSCDKPAPHNVEQSSEQKTTNTDKQYHCDIQVKLNLPLVGLSTQNGEMTVMKHDRGWVVLNNN